MASARFGFEAYLALLSGLFGSALFSCSTFQAMIKMVWDLEHAGRPGLMLQDGSLAVTDIR